MSEYPSVKGECWHQHQLAPYTSWRVGGVADHFFRPKHLADLQHFLSEIPREISVTWLGLGSNTLIREGGIRGWVVHTLNRLDQLQWLPDGRIRVEAGVPCAKLAKFCVRHGFEEGAFFAGIPGTVGGALRMNAGAFGGETWRYVDEVEVLSRGGESVLCTPFDFQVGYRQVAGLPPGGHFSAGIFRFVAGDSERAKTHIKRLLRQRNETQPIGTLSCGSVFRNPPDLFAAQLIEQSGLKGCRMGGAVVSEKHANFILNDQKATATDIEALICHVHDVVLLQKQVDLVRECHILGEP